MGIRNDPCCHNCEEGPETATHFICEYSRYATLRCHMRSRGNFICILQTLKLCRTLWDSLEDHRDSHCLLGPSLVYIITRSSSGDGLCGLHSQPSSPASYWNMELHGTLPIAMLIVDCSRPHRPFHPRYDFFVCIVDTTLHDNPCLVIDWVQIWAIWMPQVRRNKVRCFMAQKVNGFTSRA